MRHLFTLVKAGLLALIPYLFATLISANVLPDWSINWHSPPLTQLLVPINAALTVFFGYEAGIRVVPTEKDRSLINFILRLVNEYLPNRATGYASGKPLTHGLAY